tara:strand:+ start:53 stop:628 length:576 start_codon:yes stop_codon:yes gene_type:complete
MSSKISNKNFDNVFDNLMYRLSDKISPILYKYNITPNQITILGIISGLISCYYLYIDELHLSFLFIMISCFFDDLDGHHARKYKLVSKFGDLLDHVGDIIKTICLIYVIYIKYFSNFYNIKELIIFILIINFIHNSCIYEILDTNNAIFNRKFCVYPKNYIESILSITKHFQNTILIVYLYIYLYYIKYYT